MAEIYDTPGPMPISELTMERSPEREEARRIEREARRLKAEDAAWWHFQEATKRSKSDTEHGQAEDAYYESRMALQWFEKWQALANEGEAFEDITEAGLDC
jgi:hypothetical protein